MKSIFLLPGFLVMTSVALGQPLKLDHLDRLGSKASETVNVTLDGSLLRLASRFLSDGDSDTIEIKRLVNGLRNIVVRSFEFKAEGEYLESDVEAIRAQLHNPAWKKIVEIRSKTEGNSDIYLQTEDNQIKGLTVISAEPKQLTVVSIDGTIDIDGLRKLGGNFGIPGSVRKRFDGKSK